MAFEIWENFTQGILDYGMETFSGMEPWTYPFIFVGIIGFVYATMKSVIVAIIGIIITFGLYATTTNIFVDMPDISLFLYIVAVVGIAMLIVALVIKRRP